MDGHAFANVFVEGKLVGDRWAKGWPAVGAWGDAARLSALLEGEVAVLRSPDGRHFLKRDCDVAMEPFVHVVETLFAARGEDIPQPDGASPLAPEDIPQPDGPSPLAPEDIPQPDGASQAPAPTRVYARAPLAEGLRAGVELSALEQLVGGESDPHMFREGAPRETETQSATWRR
eukprot:1186083-Prorocentrum_minimum.AAC.2